MAKVNFTKVEKSFEHALQRLLIENLSELATIVDATESGDQKIANKAIEEIIERFQKQLQKIKKQEPSLFQKLNLTPEDEVRLELPPADYEQRDWLRLKELKTRIDELKHELYGKESINATHDAHIEKERRRHINKRFNIRDGWLPLK